MNHIIIAGPDKLGISSFTKFLTNYLGNLYSVGELHSLMSQESLNSYFKDFISKYSKGILTYYIKKGVKLKPEEYISSFLQENVDVIVWFDLYSDLCSVNVVKDKFNELNTIIEEWCKFIKTK